MYEDIAYFMYIINGISSLLIVLFFTSKHGDMLRKILIFYFLAFAQYQFAWAINFYLLNYRIAIGTVYWYIANTPIVCANVMFLIYIVYCWMYDRYWRNTDE